MRLRYFALPFSLLLACAAPTNPTGAAEGANTDADITKVSISSVLDPIAAGTTWASLPEGTKAKLSVLAKSDLKAYEKRFTFEQLSRNLETFRKAPTSAMNEAFDKYALAQFPSVLTDATFKASTDLPAPLASALRAHYIVRISAVRHHVFYTKDLLDWDGVAPLTEFAQPSPAAIAAYEKLASIALQEASKIDAKTLTPSQVSLLERIRADLRGHAVGSMGQSYGSEALLSVWGRAGLGGDLTSMGGASGAIKDGESFLRQVNAYYSVPVKYLDVGTLKGAEWLNGFIDGATADAALGAGTNLSKNYQLLVSWFNERLQADKAAQKTCTVYTKADRDRMWEAFSADNLFNNDRSTPFEAGRAQLDAWSKTYLQDSQVRTKAAVTVFAKGGGLTDAQRDEVLAAIDAETKIGAVLPTAKAKIDAVTGGTTASAAFQAKIDAVPRLGTYPDDKTPVSAADKALVESAWTEVKTYLKETYGVTNVDDIIDVDNSASVFADNKSGEIHFGLQYMSESSEMDVFSTLLHEGLHSFNIREGKLIEGAALEGAANLTGNYVLPKFTAWELARRGTPDVAAYYDASALGPLNANFIGKTKATVEVLFRSSCSGPSTIDFAKQVGIDNGVTDEPSLDNIALRSHHGISYLQYGIGEILYGKLLSDVSAAVGKPVDPWTMSACGHPAGQLSPAALADIKSCKLLK